MQHENPGALGAAAGARSSAGQNWRNHSELPAPEQGRLTPVYLIRVRSTRGGDDIRKLRAILKTLLRRHELRCLSVEEEARS